jgi:hypothetical protein
MNSNVLAPNSGLVRIRLVLCTLALIAAVPASGATPT